jgi:hypothetical protein
MVRILEGLSDRFDVCYEVRRGYGVSSTPPRERPIARGVADSGLIAQIVVSSNGEDVLPLGQ